jgi:SAM-dependent methyltransferase
MSVELFDIGRAQGIAMKVLADTTATQMGTLHLIGQRLELFGAVAQEGPLTAAELAESAAIDERYAREWLSAMASDRFVEYDAATETFWMTPEQRACMVEKQHPFYVGGFVHLMPDFWGNVDLLEKAFVEGGGVDRSHFGEEWHCGFERVSGPAFINNLVRTWLPALPGAVEKLQAGGSMADVGCGNGRALIEVARAFPNASLTGYDVYAPALDKARRNADAAGVGDRISFQLADAASGISGKHDLITCHDVVHDLADPVPAMASIRKALEPGGSFFVLEFNLFSDLEDNIAHPLGMGAFGYSASLNFCLTTALAEGGIGTGTCMGERRFREFAAEAGFTSVRRIDFDTSPLHIFFELKSE